MGKNVKKIEKMYIIEGNLKTQVNGIKNNLKKISKSIDSMAVWQYNKNVVKNERGNENV